jgi:hypothetical protein
MGSGMGGGFERPVEETVVNNYYDQPGGQERVEHGGFEQGGQEQHFHESAADSARQFTDQGRAQLTDASYDPPADDQGSFNDASLDDSVLDGNLTQDDGGSFDDGGGSDDGGGGGF